MELNSKRDERRARWILFAVFLLTLPMPFYMIVVGGSIPAFSTIYFTIRGTFVALSKFPHYTTEGFFILGILWAHVIILSALIYIVAFGINWCLFRALSKRYAIFVLIILIISLFVASMFEIYRIPGHNSAPPANLIGVLKEELIK